MQFPFFHGVIHGTAPACADFPADNQRLYIRLFWSWISLRTVVWTAIASFTMFNLPMDTAEMLSWGREWCVGYHKHPPLPAWIAEIAVFLSGGHVIGVYLITHVITAVCFWAVWRLGSEMLSPRAGFFAALSLEGLVYYNYMANDIGHGVLLAATSALTTVFFYEALRSDRLGAWLTVGVAMGLTMLSKYSSAFLFIPMIAFLLHPFCRWCWKRPGPYLAAAVALVIFSPHLVWCLGNDFGPIRYALNRSTEKGHAWGNHLYYPLYFAFSQSWRLVPMLLILIPLTTWQVRLRRGAHNDADAVLTTQDAALKRFNRDFLLFVVVGPFVMHLLVALLLGVEVRDLWGHHLWTFFGLVVLFFLRTQESAWHFSWSARMGLIVSALFIAFTVGQNLLAPRLGLVYQTHLPGEPIARAVHSEWHRFYDRPVPAVVAADLFLMTSVSWYLPDRPTTCMLLDNRETPWATDADVNRTGGVILWDADLTSEEFPSVLRVRFPQAQRAPTIVAASHGDARLPPLHIGVALVPPMHPVTEPK